MYIHSTFEKYPGNRNFTQIMELLFKIAVSVESSGYGSVQTVLIIFKLGEGTRRIVHPRWW